MLAFAEYERGMIVERTQSAKMALRQNPDFKDGRPRKYTDAQIQLALDLLDSGKSYDLRVRTRLYSDAGIQREFA